MIVSIKIQRFQNKSLTRVILSTNLEIIKHFLKDIFWNHWSNVERRTVKNTKREIVEKTISLSSQTFK